MIETLRSERDGIFPWALNGLRRLIRNGYQFTISPHMERNLQEAVAEGNNLVQFMDSTGYIVLEKGTVACSTVLYRAYENWCSDNLEKPLSPKTSTQFLLPKNESTYGISYSKHAMREQRCSMAFM